MISKKRKEKITRHGYECTSVSHTTPELAQIFLEFGRDYMNDVLSEKREKFLQSILDLQGQPDRWLLLFKMGDEYIGFTHMKIDKEEKPGWGCVMEFYIKPESRRKGYGTQFNEICEQTLSNAGVSSIWLTAHDGIPFWESVGYRKTGEKADFNNYEIMEKHLN